MHKISVQTNGAIEYIGSDAAFAAIKAAGFNAVDFGVDIFHKWDDVVAGKKCEIFESGKIWDFVNEAKAAAEKYGIEFGQMHAPGPTYVTTSKEATANIQADIRKSIEICGYLGCPYIVVHPICDPSMRYPVLKRGEEYGLNIEFYTSLIPLLKKHNVVCCLENMWAVDWGTKKAYSSCCSEIGEAKKYVDELNAIAGEKRFGFCLDVGHLLLVGEDPCYWVKELGDRLVAFHIHDNDGWGDDHTLPYMGICSWDKFLKALKETDYKGTINFETSSFNRKFPQELIPAALNMLGEVGKYFAKTIDAE